MQAVDVTSSSMTRLIRVWARIPIGECGRQHEAKGPEPKIAAKGMEPSRIRTPTKAVPVDVSSKIAPVHTSRAP